MTEEEINKSPQWRLPEWTSSVTMNLRKWHVYRTRLWSLTPHVPLTAINRRGRSPPFVVGMSDCPDKNTYSQTLRLFVAFSDWRLEATTHTKLKSLKGRHNNYLILTHSQKSKAAASVFFFFLFFFFEESFSVFILKCNYRLLNGRRRPICTHVIFH